MKFPHVVPPRPVAYEARRAGDGSAVVERVYAGGRRDPLPVGLTPRG